MGYQAGIIKPDMLVQGQLQAFNNVEPSGELSLRTKRPPTSSLPSSVYLSLRDGSDSTDAASFSGFAFRYESHLVSSNNIFALSKVQRATSGGIIGDLFSDVFSIDNDGNMSFGSVQGEQYSEPFVKSILFNAPISGVTPTQPSHLATKEYVDNNGGGVTEAFVLEKDAEVLATAKQYARDQDVAVLSLAETFTQDYHVRKNYSTVTSDLSAVNGELVFSRHYDDTNLSGTAIVDELLVPGLGGALFRQRISFAGNRGFDFLYTSNSIWSMYDKTDRRLVFSYEKRSSDDRAFYYEVPIVNNIIPTSPYHLINKEFLTNSISGLATQTWVGETLLPLASKTDVYARDASTLASAKQFTTTSIAGLASESFVTSKDAIVLQAAKDYSDQHAGGDVLGSKDWSAIPAPTTTSLLMEWEQYKWRYNTTSTTYPSAYMEMTFNPTLGGFGVGGRGYDGNRMGISISTTRCDITSPILWLNRSVMNKTIPYRVICSNGAGESSFGITYVNNSMSIGTFALNTEIVSDVNFIDFNNVAGNIGASTISLNAPVSAKMKNIFDVIPEVNVSSSGIPTQAQQLTTKGYVDAYIVQIGTYGEFPLNRNPAGWLRCNGGNFSASTYPNLALYLQGAGEAAGVLPNRTSTYAKSAIWIRAL